MTKIDLKRDSALAISSTMPSAKVSCSGSPERFANGMTAMEGLLGSGGGTLATDLSKVGAASSSR